MKTKLTLRTLALPAMLLATFIQQPSTSFAQGTAFTYQGRLTDSGSPANRSYDLTFYLRDALTAGNPVGTTNTVAPVVVTNGLFTVTLDFGDGIFTGPARWLEIGVRTNGSAGAYATLAPRQPLTATPYAITTISVTGPVAASQITGTISSNNIANAAITANMLAAGSVGAAQLATNAVGSAQLADSSITMAKIATGAVGNSQLAPGTVSGELWSSINLTGAPSVRFDHTAVWTGSEIIIWGGYGGSNLNDGGRYNPALDTWAPVNPAGAPAPRSLHTAVWTGTEMIVWGGNGSGGPLSDGGRYNPVSNTWTLIAGTLPNTPAARRYHRAVWTGTEMIIWGGGIGGGIQGVTKFNDGGRYNPVSNSWTATASSNAPVARYLHTAVWTGSEMIGWGGLGQDYLDDGGRYNPAGDTWTPILNNLANTPAARSSHTAVWTGTQMIVFGGSGASALNDGARYTPAANNWTPTATAAATRFGHTAVWTGSEMVVWGGAAGGALANTGERYNPAANVWAALTTTGAPPARDRHTAVWSGSEMIVWGGAASLAILGDGARLRLSNILPASIGSPQLAVPLKLTGTFPSGSTLSGANSATGGTGVAGVSSGGTSGVGVAGDGGTGTGVRGVASGFSGIGVLGTDADGTGVAGESTSATGVYGSTTTGFGVFGISSGSGLAGRFDGDVAVNGLVQVYRGGSQGVLGGSSAAVEGDGVGGGTGVSGLGGYPNGTGVSGVAVFNGYGIYGSGGLYAGWFAGPVNVTGYLYKSGGGFRIDHPLDPSDKYLAHSFVESPDMMNIYNGNITLGAMGEAVVVLPEWFGALNKEFRYQLTCLGAFAPVYIAEEISGNRFKIGGGRPGLKVSWQVTGVRQDAWANAHRIPIEEDKAAMERGSYLHPELFGQPAEKSVEWARHPELMRQIEEHSAGPPAAPKR